MLREKLKMEVDKSINNGNNSKENVDEIVNTWVDVIKIPVIAGAHLEENEHFINISTFYSVSDLTKKENVSFNRNLSILKNSVRWEGKQRVLQPQQLIINQSSPLPLDGKKVCLSKDGSRKAIVLDKKSDGPGAIKTDILQIWNSHTLLKTYDLGELDKHKSIYTTGALGNTMVWSEDSKKLAYVAEKKKAKGKPFFTSSVKKDPNDQDDDEAKTEAEDTRGEEFALEQTWGEQLKDLSFSVIVILDTETDQFKLIELPKDEFPIDIHWVNDSTLVGTSYKIPVWRLGLIFCNNRESRIFLVDSNGDNLRFVSESGRGAFSPRVQPGGNYLIWQERAVDGPHQRPRSIMGLALSKTSALSTPTLLYPTKTTEVLVYSDFPRSCWAPDGSKFYFVTPSDGITKILSISINNGAIGEVEEIVSDSPGVESIYSIGENYMLISRSSALQSPYFELIALKDGNKRAIVNQPEESPFPPGQKIVTEYIYGLSTAPSIYMGPALNSVQPNSVPLIVLPHGGPHSVYVDLFAKETTFFLRLGYAVLKVNYIGGLGSKTDETDKLLGNVGTLDVKDCQEIAEKALKTMPSLDPSKVVVYGGSHGGFLAGHLSSYAPDFYKASVMVNPVCDLAAFVGTSDITDWVMAEAGVPFPKSHLKTFIPAVKSSAEEEAYRKCSPIHNVSKVKAPTLLLLGSEDLRVPMSQGLAYYRALKAYNKIADVRVYPDCHSLAKVPNHLDMIVHTALWFKKFLK